ncbi:cell division protein FtsA [Clostridium rectalis]|uniref:cell division protein FtsA n=1 Tax=Clostridium rectalis TaxID=2040295 RepID=UPI000F634133|nr:cell division FtsA domain-containing protein [Clostridium rectalis]
MKNTNINPKDIIFALDIGTRSIIGAVGIVKDKKFYVIEEVYVEHEQRAMVDGQIHDINLVASAVSKVKEKLEKSLNIILTEVSIAAAGRFLKTISTKSEINIDYNNEIDKDLVRSLELTAVKIAEEKVNKETGGKLYCVGYSVINYYLNGYVISNLISHKGENISAEVIATFLPRSVVDSIYSVMGKVALKVVSLTLEPIAAMEAAIPQNLRLLNLALVDIGAGTSDIAISSKDTISAYGMVSKAGDEITENIAQNCLVDFTTAESIKRMYPAEKNIKYVDVLGIENQITSEEIKKMIRPIIEKISQEIVDKVMELNGGKAPNAVFLVGGGAHTPELKDCIADKLNIPKQKIAIKGRESVVNCVCKNNSLGSIGVTVLGIALVSIKKVGHDFIDVFLNGNVISLFNSNKHTIMDVMLSGAINPKLLIARNGKNVKFTLNSIKRVSFGSLATNAKILLDNKEVNIDKEVKEGQSIEITFAKDGKDACPKIMDYVKNLYSISFYLNDIIHNLEPVALINNQIVSIENEIKQDDTVDIIDVQTLGEYIKYFGEDRGYIYYLDGKVLDETYTIREGDRIYKIKEKELLSDNIDNQIIENTKKESMNIIVNGNEIVLKGKKSYVFVDIFNYIHFDLTKVHGNLILKLNGKKASYNDKLKEGDKIEARWEK